jgi:hypothetical protein
MRLEDVEGNIFGLLVHWMYKQEVEQRHEIGLLPAGKLWSLADRFMIPELQNSLIIMIRELIIATKSPSEIAALIVVAYQSKIRTPLRMVVADGLSLGAPAILQKFLGEVQELFDPAIVA